MWRFTDNCADSNRAVTWGRAPGEDLRVDRVTCVARTRTSKAKPSDAANRQ